MIQTLLNKFAILTVLLLTFQLAACSGRPVFRGELQGEMHWQGEVFLKGDVVLAEGSRLTIDPGTKISFLPYAGADDLSEHPFFPGSELIVRGELIAKGTAEEPIIFQYHDAQAPAGSWGGINIEGSPKVLFEFCEFRQADSAVHARQSWVVVENSYFHDNLVGIRFHDTEFLIEKNLLENNGAAIRFHFGSPVICRNVLRNNGKGLFVTSKPEDYTIENNSFLNNQNYEVSLGEGVRKTVILRNNFWGEHSDESLPQRFYDGRLDEWVGVVEFLPRRTEPDPDAGIRWIP